MTSVPESKTTTNDHTTAAFDWADPLLLDDQLSDEERMIRDAARAFAQERLQPGVTDAYLNETTDPAIFPELGEL